MKLMLRCHTDIGMSEGRYEIDESFGGNGIESVAVAVQGPDGQEFVPRVCLEEAQTYESTPSSRFSVDTAEDA